MHDIQPQIEQTLKLLSHIFSKDLLGVYLYGSAIIGGMQRYSDIDLFVVLNRSTTRDEKRELTSSLLKISGIYMKGDTSPIELTIAVGSDINPWHYPPQFDFQYGEWLRDDFERNNIEPWQSKDMPDLAILVTQVTLSGKALLGPPPDKLLPKVPYSDFIKATNESLPDLMASLESDTRNVLLTLARIWLTLESDTIHSKSESVNWAVQRLPKELQQPLKRANHICLGELEEHWDDLYTLIRPSADHIFNMIQNIIANQHYIDDTDKEIKISE